MGAAGKHFLICFHLPRQIYLPLPRTATRCFTYFANLYRGDGFSLSKYFFLLRPQSHRQHEEQEVLSLQGQHLHGA